MIERISIEREKRRSKRNNKPIALKQGSEGNSIIKPPEEYLYKKLQDDFQRVTASREQDRLMKALEDRKKRLEEISLGDLKQHQQEYVKKLNERQSMGELRRVEEAKKSH